MPQTERQPAGSVATTNVSTAVAVTDASTVVAAAAIVGCTASGKSALALAAARARPDAIEPVAVDAMQVYRRMDIGTAKPTVAERAEVPHHGIDLFDPWETCTVTEYRAAADRAVADIIARGRQAVLVGGTGLYVRAVIDQLEPPGQWPELRAQLEAEAVVGEHGTLPLHARLAAIDPTAAARMEPSNTRRVVRALEVCLGSGRPFSSFGPGLAAYPPSPTAQLALTWDRAALAKRIERRVDAMLAAGLLAEVEALLADSRGWSRTARQALGYAELADHVEGRWSLDEATAAIITKTRQFAVRQERWFRRDRRIRWVTVHDDPLEALPVLLEVLDR